MNSHMSKRCSVIW